MKRITKMSAVAAFFLGAFFVLANDSEITGNVIATAQSTNTGIAQGVGLLMIIASVGLFIISLEDSVKKEKVKSEPKSFASDYLNANNEYSELKKEYKESDKKTN